MRSLILKCWDKMEKLRKERIKTDMILMNDIEENEMENAEETKESQNTEHVREDNERSSSSKPDETDMKNLFALKAAILGLWVPCVIGKTDYTFMLVSIISFITRTLVCILAFFLANFHIVPDGTFLFHCSPKVGGAYHLDPCYSISDCFESTENITVQKMRICENQDQDLTLEIFGCFVIMTGLFSILGTFLLHRMVDYEHLFNVSKTCLWISDCPIFPSCLTSLLSPIIHRSTIFAVIENNQDEEGARKLEEFFRVASQNKESARIIASRPLNGETPLIFALKKDKNRCAIVLIHNGADISENIHREHAFRIAVEKQNEEVTMAIINFLPIPQIENMVNLYAPENRLGTIHTFLTLNFLKSVIDRSELEKEKRKHIMKLLELGPKKLYTIEGKLMTTTSSTSDKKISKEGEKHITALKVMGGEQFKFIHSISLKYGEAWGAIHTTGKEERYEEQTNSVFRLKKGETITGISTRHSSHGAMIFLKLETSTGRKWKTGASSGGEQKDFKGKRLAYVSAASHKGDKKKEELNYYKTVFYWM
jgi:hypothetical protein